MRNVKTGDTVIWTKGEKGTTYKFAGTTAVNSVDLVVDSKGLVWPANLCDLSVPLLNS